MKSLPGRTALAFLALLFAIFVLYPLIRLAGVSLVVGDGLSFSRYGDLLALRFGPNAEAALNSVWVSILSVVFSGLLGTFFAVVLTQCSFPFKKIFEQLAIVPIALPPLVGVIAFDFVFGEGGFLPRMFGALTGFSPASVSFGGLGAIVLVHVYSFYVYSYLFVSDSLRSLDGSMLEAAESLGATPWFTFRTVILPQLRAPLLGASLLTFMASMASFTAPLMFAGDKRFLTLQIYNTKLNGDLPLAAAQSMLLALISVAVFGVLTFQQRSGSRSKQSRPPKPMVFSSSVRRMLLSATIVILTIELLPLAAIVLISFSREGSWTTQILPDRYTLENYSRLITDPSVFLPIRNSLWMAGTAVVITAITGTAAGYALVKGGLRRRRIPAEILLGIPYALPGTVVAVGLILAFNTPHWFTGGLSFVGTLWILPLAYVVRNYPLVVRSTASALEGLDDAILEAGKTLGGSGWRILRTLVLPLIFPGIISGVVLVYVAALGEFVSSILLYTYDSRPISVETLAQLRMFSFGTATAYSVFLLVLIVIGLSFAGWLGRRLNPLRGFSAKPGVSI